MDYSCLEIMSSSFVMRIELYFYSNIDIIIQVYKRIDYPGLIEIKQKITIKQSFVFVYKQL